MSGRRTSVFNINFLAPTRNTPFWAPSKKFMCLISWERTQTRDPHKLFRGDFGGQKGGPKRAIFFSFATKSLVYCFFPALSLGPPSVFPDMFWSSFFPMKWRDRRLEPELPDLPCKSQTPFSQTSATTRTRDKLKRTNGAKFGGFFFADFCWFSLFLELAAFGRCRFSQKTAANRRSQNFAETRLSSDVGLQLQPTGPDTSPPPTPPPHSESISSLFSVVFATWNRLKINSKTTELKTTRNWHRDLLPEFRSHSGTLALKAENQPPLDQTLH